jgi:NTE family protein
MRAFFIALALAASACATPQTPINAAAAAPYALEARAAQGEDLIILSLSGGGARAASFSLGVMQALHDALGHDGRPLTEHVALITSVSGGSILAAYYGLHGDAGLDTFRAAYLDKAWPIHRAGLTGLTALAGGGMNGPRRLADWLDAEVYGGAHMSALTGGPRIVLNATDLYNATPFAFTPLFFDGLCSDLGAVRIGDAVAASMAAPVLFRPVLAESFPSNTCAQPGWVSRVLADRSAPEIVRSTARAFVNYRGQNTAQQRYLHLSDGGTADNFGLLSFIVTRAAEPAPAPLTQREALQARRIVVIVVNSEYVRARTFQQRPENIGAYEMLYSPLDAATDVSKRAALDDFRATLPDFERDVRAYRCGAAPGPGCNDVSVAMDVISLRDLEGTLYADLIGVETDVTLARGTVDRLIAAGRIAVEHNAMVASLAQ